MPRQTRLVTNKVRDRFVEVTRYRDIITLEYPGHTVSREPIVSRDYANCNGVALLGHNIAGLSHYDTPRHSPESYLPLLIEEISAFDSLENLTAALVGGDYKHFERNRKILKEYGIQIVGKYLDDWKDIENSLDWTLYSQYKLNKSHKHLAVIPKTREVLLFNEQPVRFLQLTLNPCVRLCRNSQV